MRAVSASLRAVALILLLAGCGVFKAKEKAEAKADEKPARGGVALIGIVEQVNPEQRYVLIRCDQILSLPPGTELIALDASGARSRLVLTPERKSYYLTADIKEGSPQVTNLVMYYSGNSSEAPAAPAPGPPAAPSLPLPAPAAPPPPGGALPLEPPLPQPSQP